MFKDTDKNELYKDKYNKNKINLYLRKGIKEETKKWILNQEPALLLDILSKYHEGELISKDKVELQAYKMAIKILSQINMPINQGSNISLAPNDFSKIENVISREEEINKDIPINIDKQSIVLNNSLSDKILKEEDSAESNAQEESLQQVGIEEKIDLFHEVSASESENNIDAEAEEKERKRKERLAKIRQNMAKDNKDILDIRKVSDTPFKIVDLGDDDTFE